MKCHSRRYDGSTPESPSLLPPLPVPENWARRGSLEGGGLLSLSPQQQRLTQELRLLIGLSNGPPPPSLGPVPASFAAVAVVFRLSPSSKLIFQPIVCLSVSPKTTLRPRPRHRPSLDYQNRLSGFRLSRIVSVPPARRSTERDVRADSAVIQTWRPPARLQLHPLTRRLTDGAASRRTRLSPSGFDEFAVAHFATLYHLLSILMGLGPLPRR